MSAFDELVRAADTTSAVMLRIERRKDYIRREYDTAAISGTVDCPRCSGFIDWRHDGPRSIRAKCRTPGCFAVLG